jgi:hypothetical protein
VLLCNLLEKRLENEWQFIYGNRIVSHTPVPRGADIDDAAKSKQKDQYTDYHESGRKTVP